jgi:hypothetical protein
MDVENGSYILSCLLSGNWFDITQRRIQQIEDEELSHRVTLLIVRRLSYPQGFHIFVKAFNPDTRKSIPLGRVSERYKRMVKDAMATRAITTKTFMCIRKGAQIKVYLLLERMDHPW